MGHMAHVGSYGSCRSNGSDGSCRSNGSDGSCGSDGTLGRLDQMGHLGTDKPYEEEKMTHCISTSFACAVKFRILKAVSTKC